MKKWHFLIFQIFYYITYYVKLKGQFWKPKSNFFDPSNKIKVALNIFLHQKIYGMAYLFEIFENYFLMGYPNIRRQKRKSDFDS